MKVISCSDASSAYAAARSSASANIRGQSERREAPTGGISAPAAAAAAPTSASGASSSASTHTQTRSAGKITARERRIRACPRLSTRRPAIGEPTAVATK